MLSARHQQPQRGGARLCRTQRHQCPDTGQRGGHHQNCHDSHLPPLPGGAFAFQNDFTSTRRIELQRLSGRKRTRAANRHRRNGTRLRHASPARSRLRLGKELVGSTLRHWKTLPASSKTVRCKTGNRRTENGKSLAAERKIVRLRLKNRLAQNEKDFPHSGFILNFAPN